MASETKTTITLEAQVSDALKALDALGARFRDVGKAAREGLGQQMKPAGEAVEGLEGKLKSFKKEQVQEGRLVGFYVRELGSFAGASSSVQNAIGGMTQGMVGLATATGPVLIAWALFEVAAAGLGYIRDSLDETEKKAKEAAESLGQIGDKVDELRRKRQNVKESDYEGDRVAAAERLLARRQVLMDQLSRGSGLQVQDDTARRLNDLNREIAAWEELHGKLEANIAKQRERVEELKLAEEVQRGNVTAELNAEAVSLKARTARQKVEAEHSKEVLAAQRKWLAGEMDAVQMGQAINNSLQKRANAYRDIGIEETAKHGALRIEAQLIGVIPEERKIELEYEKDLLRVAELRAKLLTQEANLTQQVAEAKRAEAERQLRHKRIAEQVQQDELAGGYGGFEDTVRLVDMDGTAKRASEHLAAVNKQLQDMNEMWGSIGSSVSSAFGSIGEMVGGVAGKVLSWLGQMITQAIQLAVSMAAAGSAWTTPLGTVAIAGLVAAGLLSLISSISARAMGGPVSAGAPYLVGERGPELIVPRSAGTVIPNHQLGSGVNVTINAAALDQAWWRSNERHIVRTLSEAVRSGRA